MRNLLTMFLLVLSLSSASGLFCWLCAKGSGFSFEDCNTRKKVQNCSESKYQEAGKGPLDRCAYFSYYSLRDKKRIYAKSCTFASYCTENGEEFCRNVRGGATQCQVECCPDRQCNDREQFKVVKNWTAPTSLPDVNDKYWCTWKDTNASFMVSGILAVVACAVACVFLL